MLHQFCPKCRTRNDTGAKFCPKCGTSNVVTPRSGPDAAETGGVSGLSGKAPFPSRVSYNPEIIGTFSEDLYRQANLIVFFWTVLGALAGAGLLGLVLNELGLVLGLVLGGMAGYFYGESRSFMLRLQAQLALCAVQIELNTRRPA